MKLTKYIRDAFISSVMNDVPSVDYDEQIRIAYKEEVIAAMPEKLRTIMSDPGVEGWLNTGYTRIEGVRGTLSSYKARNREAGEFLPAKSIKRIVELERKREKQNAERGALREKITAVAYGCSTRKMLADALPEFEKYLPPDHAAAVRGLPVVANVVSDFVKAGWPKGAKAA